MKKMHMCSYCYNSCPELLLCSKCRSSCYCNKKCQTSDWPEHKLSCKQYNISVNTLGNCLKTGSKDSSLLLNISDDKLSNEIYIIISEQICNQKLPFEKIFKLCEDTVKTCCKNMSIKFSIPITGDSISILRISSNDGKMLSDIEHVQKNKYGDEVLEAFKDNPIRKIADWDIKKSCFSTLTDSTKSLNDIVEKCIHSDNYFHVISYKDITPFLCISIPRLIINTYD